jgi:hypothetical protein
METASGAVGENPFKQKFILPSPDFTNFHASQKILARDFTAFPSEI